MTQQNQEDYLITMYRLWEKSQEIRSVDIANKLKIAKASVSEMLNKLSQRKYIIKTPYSNIKFTSKGRILAKKLTFKHRVIEVFLKDVLECKQRNIHQEAHKLEHAFSDQAIKKLAKLLKNHNNCPDGDKIPKI